MYPGILSCLILCSNTLGNYDTLTKFNRAHRSGPGPRFDLIWGYTGSISKYFVTLIDLVKVFSRKSEDQLPDKTRRKCPSKPSATVIQKTFMNVSIAPMLLLILLSQKFSESPDYHQPPWYPSPVATYKWASYGHFPKIIIRHPGATQ